MCVYKLGFLSICIEYGLETYIAKRNEIIVLELNIQIIGIQNSPRTCVRPTEDVRVIMLEIQPTCSLY